MFQIFTEFFYSFFTYLIFYIILFKLVKFNNVNFGKYDNFTLNFSNPSSPIELSSKIIIPSRLKYVKLEIYDIFSQNELNPLAVIKLP